MTNTQVKKAIIPVAGLGTRFLPATKAQPKEMLPIVDTPIIQFLVEEAVEAGVEEIIFVTGKGKRALEDHFDYAPELEASLERNGKHEEVARIRAISDQARFAFVRQKQPLGDGDAILQAAHLIDDEPVAVLFGDDIIVGEECCLSQLLRVFQDKQAPVVALEEVPESEVHLYGIIKGEEAAPGLWRLADFVEKPRADAAPSRLAAVGKYIITPDIFQYLRKLDPDDGGEVRLADALKAYLADGGEAYGRAFVGERFDCGSKLGFLKATVEHGLRHPETREAFAAYLHERGALGEEGRT